MKVAILAGGLSNEREVSLWTSEQVAQALPKDKYDVRVVEVNPDNKWIAELQNGNFDFVFIALHGKFGEDGKVQSVLDLLKLPYNGSGVTASALAFDKIKTYQFMHAYGVPVPKFLSVIGMPSDLSELGKVVHEHIGYPCVVKPNESGSSVGVTILGDPTKLADALKVAFKEDQAVIVQQYIKGRELTCGVMGNSGQMQLVTLPPVEIIAQDQFFDYEAKYKGKSQEVCPAQIPDAITKKVQELSAVAHQAINCRGLTRSDFIWVPGDIAKNPADGGQIYFLEINTLPGQTKESLCPKEAAAIGMSFSEFLEKQIQLGNIK